MLLQNDNFNKYLKYKYKYYKLKNSFDDLQSNISLPINMNSTSKNSDKMNNLSEKSNYIDFITGGTDDDRFTGDIYDTWIKNKDLMKPPGFENFTYLEENTWGKSSKIPNLYWYIPSYKTNALYEDNSYQDQWKMVVVDQMYAKEIQSLYWSRYEKSSISNMGVAKKHWYNNKYNIYYCNSYGFYWSLDKPNIFFTDNFCNGFKFNEPLVEEEVNEVNNKCVKLENENKWYFIFTFKQTEWRKHANEDKWYLFLTSDKTKDYIDISNLDVKKWKRKDKSKFLDTQQFMWNYSRTLALDLNYYNTYRKYKYWAYDLQISKSTFESDCLQPIDTSSNAEANTSDHTKKLSHWSQLKESPIIKYTLKDYADKYPRATSLVNYISNATTHMDKYNNYKFIFINAMKNIIEKKEENQLVFLVIYKRNLNLYSKHLSENNSSDIDSVLDILDKLSVYFTEQLLAQLEHYETSKPKFGSKFSNDATEKEITIPASISDNDALRKLTSLDSSPISTHTKPTTDSLDSLPISKHTKPTTDSRDYLPISENTISAPISHSSTAIKPVSVSTDTKPTVASSKYTIPDNTKIMQAQSDEHFLEKYTSIYPDMKTLVTYTIEVVNDDLSNDDRYNKYKFIFINAIKYITKYKKEEQLPHIFIYKRNLNLYSKNLSKDNSSDIEPGLEILNKLSVYFTETILSQLHNNYTKLEEFVNKRSSGLNYIILHQIQRFLELNEIINHMKTKNIEIKVIIPSYDKDKQMLIREYEHLRNQNENPWKKWKKEYNDVNSNLDKMVKWLMEKHKSSISYGITGETVFRMFGNTLYSVSGKPSFERIHVWNANVNNWNNGDNVEIVGDDLKVFSKQKAGIFGIITRPITITSKEDLKNLHEPSKYKTYGENREHLNELDENSYSINAAFEFYNSDEYKIL